MKKIYIMLSILTLFALIGCNSDNTYKIGSDSMSPTIKLGAKVKIEALDNIDDLSVGDYVLYTSMDPNDNLIIYAAARVVEFEVQANGDYELIIENNSQKTNILPFYNVIGKIVDIKNP